MSWTWYSHVPVSPTSLSPIFWSYRAQTRYIFSTHSTSRTKSILCMRGNFTLQKHVTCFRQRKQLRHLTVVVSEVHLLCALITCRIFPLTCGFQARQFVQPTSRQFMHSFFLRLFSVRTCTIFHRGVHELVKHHSQSGRTNFTILETQCEYSSTRSAEFSVRWNYIHEKNLTGPLIFSVKGPKPSSRRYRSRY